MCATLISLSRYFLPPHFGQVYLIIGISLFIFILIYSFAIVTQSAGFAQCLVKDPFNLTIDAAELVRSPFLNGTQLLPVNPYYKRLLLHD